MTTRVYWHGVFPKIGQQGDRVGRPGTIRTEVRWDGADHASLENNDALKLVSQWKRCTCGRCGAEPVYLDGKP